VDIGQIAAERALGIIIESAKIFGNWRKIMDAALLPVEVEWQPGFSERDGGVGGAHCIGAKATGLASCYPALPLHTVCPYIEPEFVGVQPRQGGGGSTTMSRHGRRNAEVSQ
jgi:hypothetical protein